MQNLQQGLEKKDPQQFFAWPVTDQIAPNYSQVIHQPMDFSTMNQKIEDNQYPTLKDYVVSSTILLQYGCDSKIYKTTQPHFYFYECVS